MNGSSPSAAVIGGGPAGLMAAEVLARGGVRVTVYERMPSAGRKFLLAGRGGLNLTHSEPLPGFLARYGDADPKLRAAVQAFPPQSLRDWADALGQETFTGSSGRVFPKAMKASPLLRAWLRGLDGMGVTLRLRHRWTGWDGDALRFETPEGEHRVSADVTVLALGGASWPKLGSDGRWTEALQDIDVTPLAPANSGVTAEWSDIFREFEGQPLKRIAIACGGKSARGEAIVTRGGLEGGAVYALSDSIRAALARGTAILTIDLLPDMAKDALAKKLSAPRGKQSLSNVLRKTTKLSPAALGLAREGAVRSSVPLNALDADALAAFLKDVPVTVTGMAPLATAISTAGGVSFGALDGHFMLTKRPGIFAAGEMLDWEAPTGGYLLQACFATGVAAANGALAWMKSRTG